MTQTHGASRRTARYTAAVLALVASCGTKKPSAPASIPTGSATAVTIAPADTTIPQGGTVQVRAAITDSAGTAIGGLRPALASSVSTNTEIDMIPVKGAPFEVIVTPGDSILYVSTNLDSVYGIRLATSAQVASFAVPALADGFALREDTLLYVGTYTGGTVVEFNLRTRTISRTFSVGGVPQKVAVSPDASTLYIANQKGYVQFWNLTTGAQIGGNLALPGGGGYGIARNPANGFLYVSTTGFGGGRIHIIDPTTRTLLKSITAGGATRRVVFNASGSVGFVTNESGWVDFLR